MKLTEVERLTLANQYRILEKLEPDAEGHRHAAEALESGYEGLYERLMFQWISKPVPEAISVEVQDIFDMYRALSAAYRAGVPKPTGGHAEFDGFDGNNDIPHSVGQFLVHKLGLWQELQNRPMNSHSQAELPSYRRMLKVWHDLGKPHPPTAGQVTAIVAGA